MRIDRASTKLACLFCSTNLVNSTRPVCELGGYWRWLVIFYSPPLSSKQSTPSRQSTKIHSLRWHLAYFIKRGLSFFLYQLYTVACIIKRTTVINCVVILSNIVQSLMTLVSYLQPSCRNYDSCSFIIKATERVCRDLLQEEEIGDWPRRILVGRKTASAFRRISAEASRTPARSRSWRKLRPAGRSRRPGTKVEV